jgi:hypothetical protein
MYGLKKGKRFGKKKSHPAKKLSGSLGKKIQEEV